MKFLDLISLIAENLGRRKGRVVLTAIGVVIGTAAVVILVSLATGLQRSYTSQFSGIGDLTLIQVYPNYGDSGGGMVISTDGSVSAPNAKMLLESSLQEIQDIPGVEAVIPRDWIQTGGIMQYGRLETYPNIMGVGTKDLSVFDYPIQSGSLVLERGTAVMGAEMLKNFYDPKARPGQEMPEPPDLQGKMVKIILSKWSQDGTETRKTINVRIVGIIAPTRGESDWTMYMPLDDVTKINEWASGRRVNRNKEGYSTLTVKASDLDTVVDIADQINALGYQASTAQSFVQSINSFFVILQVVFGGVGAVALLVAAIGIANTMTMAILERTREIGLMKAVGATNNNVLSVFLGEAAGIGFLGGLGGVALGWGASKLLDVLAMSYIAQQASSGGGMSSVSVYTPAWLPMFAVFFATLVGLLSGLYPALRAATLVPVTALKYE
jgi:putative ABC transport system permease protein